jgi:DNA-binding response OmpR family regulator
VRVLVVEDEPVLADDIADGLRHEGLAVDVAYDGVEGFEKAAVNRYDVIVLDRDLPRLHGDELCRRLGEVDSTARVLMLTAAAGIEQRVEGLGLGADDYLPKPFAFVELVARIQALVRRAEPPGRTVLSCDGVVLDRARHVVTRDGGPIELSRKEFGVLEVLLAAGGEVVSAEELLERVWDEHVDPFTNAVRIAIVRLRKKLGEPEVVETVKGVGYRVRGAT